jgi:predicted flavoprotein YhiN
LAPQIWVVDNSTTGGQSLQFIGATGTGVTVANARRAVIFSDGTNIVRASPDQA